MKKIKSLLILIVLLSFSTVSFAQSNASDKTDTSESKDVVSVYYFHVERRCLTCKTVESVSKAAVAELYNGSVNYKVFNLDGDRGKEMAKKLKIAGQSLVIVQGETKIDITTESFRHAKNDPDRVKALIKEKTDPLLK
ncbi:MAG: nitrophenyl compound nitroreductase subunit ArsF family protein [Bacteroidales bacterium]|nr:nitrophenyl compound nitroreductase subunit ArsF family protein [Bacteroidales bacterium]